MDTLSYKAAVTAVRAHRVRAELAARAVYERALGDETFYRADMAYRTAALDCGVGRITAADLDKARAARAAALARLGLTEADLEPKYGCPVCRDTGIADGRICKCAVDLFIRSAAGGLAVPLNDFAAVTPQPFQEKYYRILKSFAERFPATNKRVVLLLGGAGVGKTMLAGCVADAVVKRGYTVMAMTAFGFTDRMSRYHTTFDDSREGLLRPVLDCDLLILDDLGAEPVYRNVTREYLYLVVNERNTAGRHTLITSNLNVDGLTARYGERTASRLLDKSICYAAEIVGPDQRRAGGA